MTTPVARRSPLACADPSGLLLSFAVFIAVALAGQAYASQSATSAWQGSYHSNARNEDVTVLLTLTADAKAGELRFVTLSCAVGLQLESNAPTGRAVYVIQPRQDAAGPYCGSLLGGSLELARPVGGGQNLGMTVTKGNSKIRVNNLAPASATR